MGADYIKDLIVDEEKNKITCKMADCKDRQRIFRNFEYTSKNNLFEEKYSELLWDIFALNVHFYDQKHKLSTLIYAKELKNYFKEIIVMRAGGVISSHCGPGTLGVLFIKEK